MPETRMGKGCEITFYVSKGKQEPKSRSGWVWRRYRRSTSKARTAKATTKHCVNVSGNNYPSSYPGTFNLEHISTPITKKRNRMRRIIERRAGLYLDGNSHLSISQLWFSNPAAQPGEAVTAYVRFGIPVRHLVPTR